MKKIFLTPMVAALGLVCAASAFASDAVRVGLIATYSGPYADYGRQFDAGVALYLKETGGSWVARKLKSSRKIPVVLRLM